VFVDPIADIAVLGSPDDQALSKQADAYDALIDEMVALEIGELPLEHRRPEPLTIAGKTYEGAPLAVPSKHPGGSSRRPPAGLAAATKPCPTQRKHPRNLVTR
jgi:hypothetical protein